MYWRRFVSGTVGCSGGTFSENSPVGTTTQTLPSNYPGSCSQREPKSAEADDVRSPNSRCFVCGALALALIREGLITHCAGVQSHSWRPSKIERLRRVAGGSLGFHPNGR